MGSIRGASKPAAANPIRLPECLAIHVQIPIAMMIAENRKPNASLKLSAPSQWSFPMLYTGNITFFEGGGKGFRAADKQCSRAVG